MPPISLGTPSRYKVNQRVLFTRGPSQNRPGVVQYVRPATRTQAEMYQIRYQFYLPTQRTVLGYRPDPREIFCTSGQMLLVLDEELHLDEFLRLMPIEVTVRYFN